MNDGAVTMTLTPAERKLIATLRELPESRLRNRVRRLMDDLVTFLQSPRCESIQADGVPCPTAHEDCDHCRRLDEMLARLVEVPPEVAEPENEAGAESEIRPW